MMKRLASDLSPAQLLIGQISCKSCQDFAIEAHFRQAMRAIERQKNLKSWQKKRLFALLSPMYLEVVKYSVNHENNLSNHGSIKSRG